MPDDARTVDVPIPVEASLAAALSDPRARAAVGRLVSRALGPTPSPGELAEAVSEVKAETRLHDKARAADDEECVARATALAAEFFAFRRGRRLGQLDPKALIREGLQ